MADFDMKPGKNAVQITMNNVGADRAALLESLEDCSAGQCECMTGEDARVEAVQFRETADGFEVDVHAKPGKDLDMEYMQKALDKKMKNPSGSAEDSCCTPTGESCC